MRRGRRPESPRKVDDKRERDGRGGPGRGRKRRWSNECEYILAPVPRAIIRSCTCASYHSCVSSSLLADGVHRREGHPRTHRPPAARDVTHRPSDLRAAPAANARCDGRRQRGCEREYDPSQSSLPTRAARESAILDPAIHSPQPAPCISSRRVRDGSRSTSISLPHHLGTSKSSANDLPPLARAMLVLSTS
jgi:hypothetical protein